MPVKPRVPAAPAYPENQTQEQFMNMLAANSNNASEELIATAVSLFAWVGEEISITSKMPDEWLEEHPQEDEYNSGAMLLREVFFDGPQLHALSDEGWSLWVTPDEFNVEEWERE